jgi:hypothetical protein
MRFWLSSFAVLLGICALPIAEAAGVGTNRYPMKMEILHFFGTEALQVTIAADGQVRVNHYPETWKAVLTVVQFSTAALFKDLSEGTCRDVETQTRTMRDPLTPPLMRERLFETLRKVNPIVLRLELAPLFSQGRILSGVREKLKSLGVELTTLNLENPIQWKDVRFSLVPSEGSIVQSVEDLKSLETSWSEQFREGVIHGGTATGQMTAIDLLCDLASKKTAVKADLKGIEANGRKTRPLLSADDAKEVSDLLLGTKFEDGLERGAFGRNRILATEKVVKFMDTKMPLKFRSDLIEVVERLTNPQTGVPLRLNSTELQETMILLEAGSLSYEASPVIILDPGGHP